MNGDPLAKFRDDPLAKFRDSGQPPAQAPKDTYFQGGEKPVWEAGPETPMPAPGTSQGWSMPGMVTEQGGGPDVMGSYTPAPDLRLVKGDIDWRRGTFPENPEDKAREIDARTAGDIRAIYSRWSPDQQAAKKKELNADWTTDMFGNIVARTAFPNAQGGTDYGPWESLEEGSLRSIGHAVPAMAGSMWGALLPVVGTGLGAGGMEALHQKLMGASTMDAAKLGATTGATNALADVGMIGGIAGGRAVGRGMDAAVDKLAGSTLGRKMLREAVPGPPVGPAAGAADDALRPAVEGAASAAPEVPPASAAAPAVTLSENQMKRAVQAHAERQALEQSAPKPEGVEYVKATVDDVYEKILKDAPKTKVRTDAGQADAVEVSGKWVSNRGKVEEFKGLIHADREGPAVGALRRPVIETKSGMKAWAKKEIEKTGEADFLDDIRKIAQIEKMPNAEAAPKGEILEWFRTHPRGKTSGKGAPDVRDTGRLRFTEDEITRPESKRYGMPGHSTPAVRDFVELRVGDKTYRFLTPDEVPVETPETAQALRDLLSPRVSTKTQGNAPEGLPVRPAAPGGLQAEGAGLKTAPWLERQGETLVARARKAIERQRKWAEKGGSVWMDRFLTGGALTAAAHQAMQGNLKNAGLFLAARAAGAGAQRGLPYARVLAGKAMIEGSRATASPMFTPAWRAAAYSLAEKQRREKSGR